MDNEKEELIKELIRLRDKYSRFRYLLNIVISKLRIRDDE